jgi:acetyl esterase/lipase
VFHAPTSKAPILLYLPPGPVVPESLDEEERVITTLKESSAATIVRINYRASSVHQYPTPCHDVLLGYDWVCEHLLIDEFNRPYLARLGVCGELVGGSLATMLALTECRVGENRIGAAAINNPIVDWVFPDELPVIQPEDLPEPQYGDETQLLADEDMAGSLAIQEAVNNLQPERKRSRKHSSKPPPPTSWQAHGENAILPAWAMSERRDVLFRKPQDYFDRFASPLHYFRSPHAQLIFPQQDDIFASQQPDELLDIETQMALNHYATFEDSIKAPPAIPTLSRCRAYARSYPPAGNRLTLPIWNITTGLQSPLSDTTLDLAKHLRRSIARQILKTHSGRSRWHDAAEKKQYEEIAQDRVELHSYEGVGLWSRQDADSPTKPRVEDIGAWMKQQLEPGFG